MSELSELNNYEQILYDFLSNFVDKNKDNHPLVFRNSAPTLEEVEEFGDKVYCVYTVFEGDFGQQTIQPVSFYSYGSQQNVFEKKELLSKVLQNGAYIVKGNGILVKFTSGNPFVQDATDSDENIKGYLVNILTTVFIRR